MNSKIVITVLAGIGVAALIGAMWWWFLSKPNQIPAAATTSGTFGVAGDATNQSSSGDSTQTNIGAPLHPNASSNTAVPSIVPGTYVITRANGGVVGTYVITNATDANSSAPAGSFTITSVQGPEGVAAGTYQLAPSDNPTSAGFYAITQIGTNQGPAGTVAVYTIVAQQSATVPQTTAQILYGKATASTTNVSGGSTGVPGVDWFIAPKVDQPFMTGTIQAGSFNTNQTPPTPSSSSGTRTASLQSEVGKVLGASTDQSAAVVLAQLYVPQVSTPGVTASPVPIPTTGATPTPAQTFQPTTSGTVFNPQGINQITTANPSGGLLPNLSTSMNGLNGNGQGVGTGLLGAALGAGATGVVSCASFLISGAFAGGIQSLMPTGLIAVQVNNSPKNSEDILDCITRNIAKIAIQKITGSVVDWINSGFEGSPSFVLNPTQFFTNVLDRSAGAFLQSSALSFLCSPFSIQIKIAIAQSYANRNNAQACTLTKATSNITNFMNGDFSSGGWAGMLSMTTEPINNPYGAFVSGSIQFNNALQSKQQSQKLDLLQNNGFLNFQQRKNCQNVPDQNAPMKAGQELSSTPDGNGGFTYQVCDIINSTPGTVIAASINKTLGESQDSLNLAKSFDEIINALITQLMTSALHAGLAALSGQGGYSSNYYTPAQLAAQAAAQTLVNQMLASINLAQQYGAIQQGAISDIQSTEALLNQTYNCWTALGSAAAQDPAGGPVVALSQTNAAQASTTFAGLEAQVTAYNNAITSANASITKIEQLQSQALSANSAADITTVTNAYNTAAASGQIQTQTDVTNAQQNRTTLQAQLAAINAQTSTSLNQCHATQP